MDAIPDQLALAANPSEPNKYRRGDNYAAGSEEREDYLYGNRDVNYIASGSKPPPTAAAPSPRMLPHPQLNPKFNTNRIRSEAEAQLALDEAKTAEEYVAKAMQMHGSRLNEPIRIPAEAEPESEEASSQAPKAPPKSKHHNKHNNNSSNNNKNNYDFYELVGKTSHSQEQQQQQQQEEEPLQQEHRHEQQEEPQRQQQLQHQHHQQQQHQHYKYQQRQQHHLHQQQQQQPSPKQLLESQLQEQLQVQMQQAQLLAEQQAERQQQQQQEPKYQHQEQYDNAEQHQQQVQQQQQQQQHQQQQQQQQQHQQQHQLELQQRHQMLIQQQELEPQQYEALTERDPASASLPQQPAPVYEKEPVTRSYELYDAAANYESQQQQLVDRHYHTKYRYQPVYHSNTNEPQQQLEEKIRVSASTEIPKAEIMKQIEKSVMRYMKELEAEGKIITTPQEPQPPTPPPPPKSYYKVMSLSAAEDKRPTSGTLRTKFTSSTSHLDGFGATGQSAHQSQGQNANSALEFSGGNRHHQPKHAAPKQQYHSTDPESAYQAVTMQQQHQHQEMSDALAPNVEFIYKIKAHAPLQTATVKTITKPYTLPLKSYEQFDHTAALKNLEDFDMSHVVTSQDHDDHSAAPPHTAHTGKPSKLYFNSEIYHDINSLPYKPEKTRHVPAEFRKLKPSDQSAEYKAYSGNFAEPSPYSSASIETDKDSRESGVQHVDEGYPVMNPYQYVLKKEPLPNQYDDSSSAAAWEKPRSKPLYPQGINVQKALEYDSYSPKFNNNPEGYGYQHSYKPHASPDREREREPLHSNHKYGGGRHGNSKRGKRGGGPLPKGAGIKKNGVRNAGVKDIEANLALRPPPKV